MTSTPTKPVDNVVIATKGLQDRKTNITAGTTVENKGKLILKDVNIQEGDMGRGDGPGKSDRIATIEVLKEEEKGIMTMSSQQEDIINKPEPKVRFRVY